MDQYEKEKKLIQELFVGCENNDVATVKRLLTGNEEIGTDKADGISRIKNAQGRTCLHFAAHGNSLDCIKFLLGEPVDSRLVDVKDEDDMTPLMLACSTGSFESCEFLVSQAGSFIHAKTKLGGITPLHYACGSGSLRLVEFLLEKMKNIGIDEKSTSTGTSLHWAVSGGHLEVVKLLLSDKVKTNPNIVDGNSLSPLIHACVIGADEIVEVLLQSKADPGFHVIVGSEVMSPYLVCASMGRSDCAKLLIKYSPSTEKAAEYSNLKDSDGLVAALAAAKAGHLECCEVFLPITNREVLLNQLGAAKGETPTAKDLIGYFQKRQVEAEKEIKRKIDFADGVAAKEKLIGNRYFQEKRVVEAMNAYSKGIVALQEANLEEHAEKSPLSVQTYIALLGNRSACYLDLGQVDDAVADAKLCVSLDPIWVKGYFRLGKGLLQKKLYIEAGEAFWKGFELDPNGSTAPILKQLFEQSVKLGKEQVQLQKQQGALKQ